MDTREWTTIDKSAWGRGPWQQEPDKRQWQDEATGLPCLMVRAGHLGHWCGYVGVPAGHPAHGQNYNGVDVEVHGGLTFSDRCSPYTVESWEAWRGRVRAGAAEAKHYPNGEAARCLREAGPALEDYDAYVQMVQAKYICHLPGPNDPDDVWWLGFDCAHSRDSSPGADRMPILRHGYDGYSQYRDAEYVAMQCRKLARQLAALTA